MSIETGDGSGCKSIASLELTVPKIRAYSRHPHIAQNNMVIVEVPYYPGIEATYEKLLKCHEDNTTIVYFALSYEHRGPGEKIRIFCQMHDVVVYKVMFDQSRSALVFTLSFDSEQWHKFSPTYLTRYTTRDLYKPLPDKVSISIPGQLYRDIVSHTKDPKAFIETVLAEALLAQKEKQTL